MNPNKKRIRLAVAQLAMVQDRADNLERAREQVREAASRGAQIVLLPELFDTLYFPRVQDQKYFRWARSVGECESVESLRRLAQELRVVLPISFFEKSGEAYFNSVAVVDADGEILGVYRKSHIPDGVGYQEKFYFRPGNTGFRVFQTRYGCIGVGICWDQWFFESSRAMTLKGADILLYPSAIGSEPEHPEIDTKEAWQRVMIGQAVGNAVVVAAANRTGDEDGQRFYGSSFIADHTGEKRAELDADVQGIAWADFDLEAVRRHRRWFGLLSDRRPELYQGLVIDPNRVRNNWT
ncbi:MAG: N-carbamoylputrescine amidase [Deltaproteobacteria bacterium]|nr:N-carbamoylputrescine amidase [Deltaproteobacteria bacterium]